MGAVADKYRARLSGGAPQKDEPPASTGSVADKYRARLSAKPEVEDVTATPPQEDRPPGFIDRSIDRLSTGLTKTMEKLKTPEAPVMPIPGAQIDTGGEPLDAPLTTRFRQAIGGEAVPAIGEVGADAVMTAGKEILPESWQDNIKDAAMYVMDSAPVKTIGRGLDAWKEASPETYEAAGEYANLAAVMSPMKAFPSSKLGAMSKNANAAARQARREKGISEMLKPDTGDGGGNWVETGILKKQKYEPSPYESRRYAEVDRTPGVDPTESNLKNINAIEAEVDLKRRNLDSRLEGADELDLSTVRGDIDNAILEIEDIPSLVGDAGKSAERIYNKFYRFVEKYADGDKIRPGDLLQARRDLDAWLKTADGKIFDNTANARGIATKALRSKINNRVNDAVPDADVARSLQQQSDLLTARDDLIPGFKAEGKNRLSRAVKKVETDTGLSPARTPLAASSNIASIPAMALTGLGTAASLGGRGLVNTMRAARSGAGMTADTMLNSMGVLPKATALAALNREKEEE